MIDSTMRAEARSTSVAENPFVEGLFLQMRREFGAVVPPFSVHAPHPEILAAVWSAFRETVLVEGQLPRTVKETIAARVSQLNACPYCVDAHTIMLDAAGAGKAARRLRRQSNLNDSRLEAFADWAAATLSPGSPHLQNPPFESPQAPEAIGTALCLHYVNRVVTVLLSDSPVPVRRWPIRNLILYMSGLYFRPAVVKRCFPGASLSFLATPLPSLTSAPSWARPTRQIATAFAALDRAVEEAVLPLVGESGRETIIGRLEEWRGEQPRLGEDIMAGRSGRSNDPAVRLALTAALAPHRVDEAMTSEFRRRRPDEADLVALLAFASYSAARRISSWL